MIIHPRSSQVISTNKSPQNMFLEYAKVHPWGRKLTWTAVQKHFSEFWSLLIERRTWCTAHRSRNIVAGSNDRYLIRLDLRHRGWALTRNLQLITGLKARDMSFYVPKQHRPWRIAQLGLIVKEWVKRQFVISYAIRWYMRWKWRL